MSKNLIFLLFVTLITSCTPLSYTSSGYDPYAKQLVLSDFSYEYEIRTITLTPNYSSPEATLLPSTAKIDQQDLLLQFDDLRPERESYYARLIHCNYDWTQSGLQDLDYLNDFNEFAITEFDYSVDTHIPYVHYRFRLPQVKLPGNYVVVVYRGSDKNDIVLSKRFMVYDHKISFADERSLIGSGLVASLNQQINFTIQYPNLEIINPLESVKVTIRQNQRWDNMATSIKPSFVREIEREMEYRFFDESNMFRGGNEFRFFDFRSLFYPGRNIAAVNKNTKPFEVIVSPDKERSRESYSQYLDYNGGFILKNFDFQNDLYSNYAKVRFTLKSKPIAADVYVAGAFNYWNLDNENRMIYDSTKQEYTMTTLLKQGWYDYQYVTKGKQVSPHQLEGTHYQTENNYEIFVYYRPFRPNADLLVGYIRIDKNQR